MAKHGAATTLESEAAYLTVYEDAYFIDHYLYRENLWQRNQPQVLFKQQEWIFQQNNWFNCTTLLIEESNYPGLNLVEHLWDTLNRKTVSMLF